jgi:ribosomal protein S18 acetylase RimI-like enzyme
MIVRTADRSDARTLSELAMETYSAAFGGSFSPSDLASHLKRNLSQSDFERMLDEDTVLVAEVEDRMVGFAQFGAAAIAPETASGNDRELRRLYVLPDFQNQGIGAALMDAVLDYPDVRGAERIYLDVWEHNPGAQRFHARYGFEVIGAREFFVESGAETSLDLIMVRRRRLHENLKE